MKPQPLLLILCFLLVTPIASAQFIIEWIDPLDFRDATYDNGPRSERSTQIVLNDLERYFTRNAKRHFGDRAQLSMTVTQLDLAGDFEAWRGREYFDVRIVRPIYPARIEFSYSLKSPDGTLLAQGSEKLLNDLFTRPLNSSFENYPYIKEIVDDWMSRLARKHTQPSG